MCSEYYYYLLISLLICDKNHNLSVVLLVTSIDSNVEFTFLRFSCFEKKWESVSERDCGWTAGQTAHCRGVTKHRTAPKYMLGF